MKYVLLFPLLSLTSIFSMDREYQLPSSEEIKQRLILKGFPFFAHNSSIGQLGGQSWRPRPLATQVNSIVTHYMVAHYHEQPRPTTPREFQIMRVLLKNHPNVLESLKKEYSDDRFIRED